MMLICIDPFNRESDEMSTFSKETFTTVGVNPFWNKFLKEFLKPASESQFSNIILQIPSFNNYYPGQVNKKGHPIAFHLRRSTEVSFFFSIHWNDLPADWKWNEDWFIKLVTQNTKIILKNIYDYQKNIKIIEKILMDSFDIINDLSETRS